jgi:hypothetical protein
MAITEIAVDGAALSSTNLLPVSATIPAAATSPSKAEDGAHASGHTGTAVLAVRRDTAAVGSDTDGDYSTINVDATGRLWAHVGAIDAGTAYIGQAAAPVQFVTVSMTTPTDAQDAGDVVAATQVVTNATRAADVPAFLESICIIDTDDQKAILTAVFFDANTSLGTEDAAPDIDDTEMLTVLGSVEFVAADYIDLGGASYAYKRNLRMAVNPASGTRNIYMALYTPATSTPTYASGIITVKLGFSSD